MEKLEKIREFLYDLDKIRSNVDAVNELILNYNGISNDSESESEGFEIQLKIGAIDDDDVKIYIDLNGVSDSLWMDIAGASDDDIKRIENKRDEIIFKFIL